ncbi:RloB family protein [Streptomyces sp. A3M-1-3]|uniref:RloB family protein n=1 Tax=Streptomyces sp. A3M-1-3 TaxID=2962044 RepID=UPI0020B8608F|nr:RloB family protein [Streptomyces sp. A3M-1-3]MCP3819975.1 RloB family protein [Streptomyces sp. A3M-1-3]
MTRPQPKRGKRRRVVHVFTEGEVTEPTYIEILKQHGTLIDPDVTVEVHIANAGAPGSQRKPIKLVEAAIPQMREAEREAKRYKLRKEHWPQVWCLFDRDDHEQIETAVSQAKKANVGVAFSHPCFEVWRLAHEKSVTGTFDGVCGLAADRLSFARTDPHPKTVRWGQLQGLYEKAKANAEAMNAQHPEHRNVLKRDPYTDVWKFVEDGMGIAGY